MWVEISAHLATSLSRVLLMSGFTIGHEDRSVVPSRPHRWSHSVGAPTQQAAAANQIRAKSYDPCPSFDQNISPPAFQEEGAILYRLVIRVGGAPMPNLGMT